MKNRIDEAAKTLTNWADSEGGLESVARNYDGDLAGAVEALDADGHLMPDLPEPTGYAGSEPYWGACDSEIRPLGYEKRVMCIDENGPWEATAQDVRELAYAFLAAADYAERNQE